MSETRRIGWIGAGKMGLPICNRFKAAGHDVQVLARTPQAEEKLRDLGLQPKPTVADVCKDADIVFSSISDDTALAEIVQSVAASLPRGHAFVDISTVSPATSAKAAEQLKQAGIAYLRSPVSGSTFMAEQGTLTVIVSGPRAAFEALQPLFAQFTRKCFHVGEAEEARTMKLVLNIMVGATSALLAEALAFGHQGGLNRATMLDVINQSVVASPLIAYKTDTMVKDDYKPAATLAMLQKDIALFLASAGTIELPLASHIHDIYSEASSRGLAEQDFFVLVQQAVNRATRS